MLVVGCWLLVVVVVVVVVDVVVDVVDFVDLSIQIRMFPPHHLTKRFILICLLDAKIFSQMLVQKVDLPWFN